MSVLWRPITLRQEQIHFFGTSRTPNTLHTTKTLQRNILHNARGISSNRNKNQEICLALPGSWDSSPNIVPYVEQGQQCNLETKGLFCVFIKYKPWGWFLHTMIHFLHLFWYSDGPGVRPSWLRYAVVVLSVPRER